MIFPQIHFPRQCCHITPRALQRGALHLSSLRSRRLRSSLSLNLQPVSQGPSSSAAEEAQPELEAAAAEEAQPELEAAAAEEAQPERGRVLQADRSASIWSSAAAQAHEASHVASACADSCVIASCVSLVSITIRRGFGVCCWRGSAGCGTGILLKEDMARNSEPQT